MNKPLTKNKVSKILNNAADLYDHKITSDESFEGEVILPATLLKHASKIERSRSNSSLHGDGVTIYKTDNISCSL